MQYGTRIAAVEIHGDYQFPLYCAEGRNRTRYYLPPISGGYYTPFLWCDGRQRGTTYSSTWRPYIQTKLNQPAYAVMTSWGVYLPAQDSGRIYVKIRNDSTGTMKGYIRFVLVEDSCYYLGPNNDPWHNHVARDYLPDTSGTFAQIAPNESVTVYRNFRVQTGWNENRISVVYWYQNDSLRADSSKPVYQAGTKKIMDMAVAIEEEPTAIKTNSLALVPNPCQEGTVFRFPAPAGAVYTIRIFDASGRRIRTISGISRATIETCQWDLRDERAGRVNPGVYLYRLTCGLLNTGGKIVVK